MQKEIENEHREKSALGEPFSCPDVPFNIHVGKQKQLKFIKPAFYRHNFVMLIRFFIYEYTKQHLKVLDQCFSTCAML